MDSGQLPALTQPLKLPQHELAGLACGHLTLAEAGLSGGVKAQPFCCMS